MAPLVFIARLVIAWGLLVGVAIGLVDDWLPRGIDALFVVVALAILAVVAARVFSHVRRVGLISGRRDLAALGSRHRQQIEIPFPPGEAFDVVEGAVRELPHVEGVDSTPDSLQVHARVWRVDPYASGKDARHEAQRQGRRNLVFATVAPGMAASRATLVCEPEHGPWLDWLVVDNGTNLQNLEAISRAIARRVAERGQALPGAAPHGGQGASTLGAEVEYTRGWLEARKAHLGKRLAVLVKLPEALAAVPMPPGLLQALAENALEHGIAPRPGGGTIWILAREFGGHVAVTVADDGVGLVEGGAGTGSGLHGVREALRLAYGDGASFSIVSNFPKGAAATLTVPKAWGQPDEHP